MSDTLLTLHIGQVGICSRGRPGLITHIKDLPWGTSYVGIGLDDGSPWSSRNPRILSHEDVVELSEKKAREQETTA